MTDVFEYEHPILNNTLTTGTETSSPRKFKSLQSWYNVINDYEFKARCPIILKNSHKNRHFTFACHLKTCEFKVLLSYAGGETSISIPQSPTNTTTTTTPLPHTTTTTTTTKIENDDLFASHNVKKQTLIPSSATSNKNIYTDSHLVSLTDHNHNNTDDDDDDDDDDVETIRKYSENDAIPSAPANNNKQNNNTDAHVTAAIAAAVAAVQDSTHHHTSTQQQQQQQEAGDGGDTDADIDTLLEHSVRFLSDDPVPGPFVVTKIYPYHNHPLEANMSLDKFVLTKIPKILQHDLNFDTTLEDLYKKGNNSMNKFKVGLFVTDSGLLDIIKERYHLDDKYIDKKYISLISRRVTTYKARFVLKKKKLGEYQEHSPSTHHTHTHTHPATIQNKISPSQALLNVTKKLLPNKAQQQQQTTADSLLSDNVVIELSNGAQLMGTDLQQAAMAAQAAINESILVKRRLTNDDTDLDQYHKRVKTNNTSQLDDINISDIGDDKLPHEVAEQLRLLSSHFKDVDASLNNSHPDDTHHLNSDFEHEEQEAMKHHHHHREHDNTDAAAAAAAEAIKAAMANTDVEVEEGNSIHSNVEDEDVVTNLPTNHDDEILDANIQPELRGQ